jgi:hypothetical protein
LVYETEVLALSTVKTWRKRFAEGRTSLYDDPRYGRSFTNDLAEAISSVLKERLYVSCKILYLHFRIAKGTCLQILHEKLGMNNSIFVGAACPGHESEGRESHLVTWNSFRITECLFYWLPECHHWR